MVTVTRGRLTKSTGDESQAVVLELVVPSEGEASDLPVNVAESG